MRRNVKPVLDVIAQANPTPEQRGRSSYVVAKTVDPYGETVVQGRIKVHRVCRRQPVYVMLHSRGVICDQTRVVLDWYDGRLALARKGLTTDSLARAGASGGQRRAPSAAAADARSDVEWARSFIRGGLRVFDDVMERELTFAEIGGGNSRKEAQASAEFKLAAAWLVLKIGPKVIPS